MTERSPSVSVLVTTFNHARYVEEALESLRRQTSRDFEVIITDDASTDGCAEAIEGWLARTGFPAQFIRNAVNRGICANRNTALARARGRFVCSLSGDDAYADDRIERQLGGKTRDVAPVHGGEHLVAIVDAVAGPGRDAEHRRRFAAADLRAAGARHQAVVAGLRRGLEQHVAGGHHAGAAAARQGDGNGMQGSGHEISPTRHLGRTGCAFFVPDQIRPPFVAISMRLTGRGTLQFALRSAKIGNAVL